jgi:hypothetical protein
MSYRKPDLGDFTAAAIGIGLGAILMFVLVFPWLRG